MQWQEGLMRPTPPLQLHLPFPHYLVLSRVITPQKHGWSCRGVHTILWHWACIAGSLPKSEMDQMGVNKAPQGRHNWLGFSVLSAPGRSPHLSRVLCKYRGQRVYMGYTPAPLAGRHTSQHTWTVAHRVRLRTHLPTPLQMSTSLSQFKKSRYTKI